MISIAMTTYNGEKYLSQQIDSILNQTYSDFELIICDDNSNDNTINILKSYSLKDKRIRVYYNNINIGFLKNFEKTISYCNGEYIAFSDQDDIWNVNKLELSLKNIGDKSLLCTNATCIDNNGNPLNYTMQDVSGTKKINYKNLCKFLVHKNFVQGSTILAKTDFIKNNLPIPESFKYHDWYFGFMAALDNQLIYFPISTIKYRQHFNQVTINKKQSMISNLFIINHTSTQMHELRCKFISEQTSLPDYIKLYAKECEKYYYLMRNNKNFWTYKFYFSNYNDFNFSNNYLYKFFEKIKRILGIIKFQIKKMENHYV